MPIKNSDIPSHSSLIIFEAAARLGSLTSAANELCVTPTAVSKQVKQLEAFLNTTLFLRKKNGLELTTKGQSYLTTVNQVLHLLSEESKKLND
ncbi:MAG: LysR family transcriptional regulator, partial [Pseudomonadota bacterium]|nr:LysR family transcriptional regulator [Pseudomonadota bacterium]